MKIIQLNKFIKNSVGDLVTGMLVGLADLFPGVSGGTVLFLTGKYSRVIYSLNLIVRKILPWKKFNTTKIEYNLILSLLLGVLLSIVFFSKIASYFFENFNNLSMILLLSLMISYSFNLLLKQRHNSKFIILLSTGFAIGIATTFIPNLATNTNIFIIIISGFLSMGFMILPGISGSSILLIIGTYQQTIQALSNLEFAYLLMFGLGGVFGFLLSLMLIKLVLDRFKNQFEIIISGMIIGASLILLINLPEKSYQDFKSYIVLLIGLIISYTFLKISNYYNKNND